MAERVTRGLVLLGLCLLSAGVYLNSLANGFALDDDAIIESNPEVHGIEALPQAITGPYWAAGPGAPGGLYRPLTLATFATDWEIWSGRPFGFHLTNVLLHAAVTAAVFTLLGTLGVGLVPAAAGAALFAVHPVHVEAVANVVGRAELLAALFFVLACLAYLKMPNGWRAAAGVAGLYLLSLFSKEIGVTLPGALVLLHLARGESFREAWAAVRDRWRVYSALVVTLLAYFVVRWLNIGAVLGGGTPGWYWGQPPGTPLRTAIRIIPEYLRLMLLPLDLVPDYGPGVIIPEPSWAGPLVVLGVLTALVSAALAVLAWRRARLVSVAVLWFAGTALPVSGLLFSPGFLLAERTLYLPSIAVAIAVAGIAAKLATRSAEARRMAALVLVLLIVAGSVRTWMQNRVWRDTGAVLTHLMEHHPNNYRAQWIMAVNLREQGRAEASLDHLRLALRMVPGHFALREEVGSTLFNQRRFVEAAAQYDTARIIMPGVERAQIRYLQSQILAGAPERAVEAVPGILERFPESGVTYHLLALALARLERWDAASRARLRSIELDPGAGRWAQWIHLAAVSTAAGEGATATAALDSARAAAPPAATIPTREQLEQWMASGNTAALPFW